MLLSRYLIIITLFVIEKWIQFRFEPIFFISNYLDDILLIPIVLGFGIWVQQEFVLATFVFSKMQILGTWLVFSIIFEGIFPYFSNEFTADFFDLFAYGFGGVIFNKLLNYPKLNSTV
ncbi:MAG: magnesium citrate secondary transporter [Bacteroidia bacterium]|nr:magnesium citrate secondary transporter [Bacteroidia bacterium]MCF8425471.1 magnesium citrate secondary transporter [Bacteroidia bacterium]MCF8445887.1 magnesium citrate secondary transporter [Bacteroidia bacterium]